LSKKLNPQFEHRNPKQPDKFKCRKFKTAWSRWRRFLFASCRIAALEICFGFRISRIGFAMQVSLTRLGGGFAAVKTRA
jgi:hypothetical protein